MVVLLFVLAGILSAQQEVVTPAFPLTRKIETDHSFRWRPALEESMRALMVQHGFRLAVQPGTRARLGGKFFSDYAHSIKAVKGWEDGDNIFINYVNHPIQGGVTNYIYLHNDPKARGVEFGPTREYWTSRLKPVLGCHTCPT